VVELFDGSLLAAGSFGGPLTAGINGLASAVAGDVRPGPGVVKVVAGAGFEALLALGDFARPGNDPLMAWAGTLIDDCDGEESGETEVP
jgi:hypothetical protein